MKKQLPVLSILVAAIDLCRDHLSYALKVVTPWFLVVFLGPCLLVSLSGEEAVDDVSFWTILFLILEIVAWGSIAVLWHWRLLRGDGLSRNAVIFDKRVWRYILKYVLILVIMVGSGFVLIMSISFPPARWIASVLGSGSVGVMFLGALLSAGIISSRLSVALPAVALNVPNFGFSDAWKATEGHEIRLLVVTTLPFIPVSLLFVEITVNGDLLFEPPLSWAPFALKHFAFEFVKFAFGLLTLTVLSLTYAFFTDRKGAGNERI